MPELPEVETVRRQLEEKVTGLTISEVIISKPKNFKGDAKSIIGSKIVRVKRSAKIIDICLDNDLHLLVHLKMTGQLIFVDSKGGYGGGHPIAPFNLEVPNKYTHIVIGFTNKAKLYYNDVRRFGWLKVVDESGLKKETEIHSHDPLTRVFTLDYFKEKIQKYKNKPIKLVLMDQSVVAGIGNIYASEICFRSGIMPDKNVGKLSNVEIKRLFDEIKVVLTEAVKYKGTSADDFVTLEGVQGEYVRKLKVYGREGEKCLNHCGGLVQKNKIAGRGTYFCSTCQT